MALPANFGTPGEYFNVCLEFLEEFFWIYKYPNTDLLVVDVMSNVPIEWKEYFSKGTLENINGVALGVESPTAPKSLNLFIQRANSLKPKYEMYDECIEFSEAKGHSFKKAHEISHLVPLIANVCVENNVEFVVDIGCGLGYLTNLLGNEHKFKVLGVDFNEKLVQKARLVNPNLSFSYLNINFNSCDDILQSLKQNFNDFDCEKDKVALIALHACADLTVDILKLVKTNPVFGVSIVMPCCYHRMKKFEEKTVNFPLSSALNLIYENKGLNLNGPFFRLACQESSGKWKNMTQDKLDNHTKNLLFRNLLEFVVANDKDKLVLQRHRRKTGSTNQDYSLGSFLENLNQSFSIKENKVEISPGKLETLKSEIRKLYLEKYAEEEPLWQGFSALQYLIQNVCENLILFDRCIFMNESNVPTRTVKVTDDEISPRCYAIVSERQQIQTANI